MHHRGPALRSSFDGPGRFEAVPLPPYGPERNPDEGVGSWVKSKDLANRCPRDNEDPVDRVRGSLGMQRRTDLARGCPRATGLRWGSLLNQRGNL